MQAERVDVDAHLFVGPRLLTVRHGDDPDLASARDALEHEPQFLSIGPEAMLSAVLDRSSTIRGRLEGLE